MQKQFEKFHRKIKIESGELREKRETLFKKIKDELYEKDIPVPEILNQGSYIYGVGIKPFSKEQEYDIDVGLVFNIKSDDYSAKEVRKWVYEAVKNHTQNVKEKGPCIRVRYQAGFHVDLVVYARYKESEDVENFQLAHKDNSWRNTDPKGLKEYIRHRREAFKDSKDSSGSDQLQRVTRYLKRWNDKSLPDGAREKPTGISILFLVMRCLPEPVWDSPGDPDDLEALTRVAEWTQNSSRISIDKPTPEYEDLFGNISDEDMAELKNRFSSLCISLEKAKEENDSEKACEIIQEELGKDFPVDKNVSSRVVSASVIPTVEATKPYAEN